MKKIVSCLILVGVLLSLLAGCGEKSKSKLQSAESIADIAEANVQSVFYNNGVAGPLWIEEFNWNTVDSTIEANDSPLLLGSIKMPAEAKTIADAFWAAEVVTEQGRGEKVIPASTIVTLDIPVNGSGCIYLYSDSASEEPLSRDQSTVEILVPVNTGHTLHELLSDGMWCIQDNAFTLEQWYPKGASDYSFDNVSAGLGNFIHRFGTPDYISNLVLESGAASYMLLWKSEDSAFGVYVKESHYIVDGKDLRTFIIAGTDYYAPSYFTSMNELTDDYHRVRVFSEYIESLN